MHETVARLGFPKKCIGMGARRKALMLRRSCFAGLQPEVAEGIVTAARRAHCEHGTFLPFAGLQLAGGTRSVMHARREELGYISYRI